MGARPSCGRYGMVLDASTEPYVECQQCNRRFVGGTHDSRARRWAEHATDTGCYSAKARLEKVESPVP